MDVVTIETDGVELTREARAALADADVIIGVETDTDREFTVFGTPSLESTVSLKRPGAMRVVRVPLSRSSDALSRLYALVRSVKGP
jgi:hypothetical protein